jgi:RNA polymerase sigma-70 factor (ECF subfamily)
VATDWNRLVQEHGAAVFGTALRILGHTADTEEVVQEVFLQAYRLHQTQVVNNWPGLLRRLAACRALDRLRQRKTFRVLSDQVPCNGCGPVATAMNHELAQRLRQAVAQLPQREGAVFCLRYFEDFSYQQIADALQISPGAAATALHKARAKLETMLTEAITGEKP